MPLPIAAADAGAGNANATPSPNKAANTIVFIPASSVLSPVPPRIRMICRHVAILPSRQLPSLARGNAAMRLKFGK
jgi:hypothetical protein